MAGDPAAGLPAPVAVWDANHRDWPQFSASGAHNWAKTRIRDLVATYRIEFILLDGPLAVVYRYQTLPGADHGRPQLRFMIRDDDGSVAPAVAEPVIVPLRDFPPKHLLRSTTPRAPAPS